MTRKKSLLLEYLVVDFFASALAWTLFYCFRKTHIELADLSFTANYFLGLIIVPTFWMSLFALTGMYSRILRRHRVKEFSQVLVGVFFGTVILFFFLLLDDEIDTYSDYYYSFSALFLLQFSLALFFRLIVTTRLVTKVHRGNISFPTLILGGNERALKLYHEITAMPKSPGFRFVGFVSTNGVDRQLMESPLPFLGKVDTIEKVLETNQIEEVIIAVETSEHENLGKLISRLDGKNIAIKLIPDMYDIVTGSVKMTSIFGMPLIHVNNVTMPYWQQSVKKILDMLLSLLAITILLPIYLFIALAIKLDSKGPVFYKQERVGKGGKLFNILKFRTMHVDAESYGPQLSSDNDLRITRVGRFLRKTRLDESPQFLNVLKGEMAIVGPRPEREYFIEKIVEKAPHYNHLLRVKPGITSWGQVKFGYAENVSQMVERLKFDILYIENMSLALDFKIMFYTILTILKGSGK